MIVVAERRTNMTINDLINVLSRGAEVRKLSNRFDGNNGLRFTLVTEPTSEFDARLEDIVENAIHRIRSRDPSLTIDFLERRLLKRLCKKIVRKATADLVSESIYEDYGLIDTDLIDSDSKYMVDDKIDELLVGLSEGRSLLELCNELCGDPVLNVRADDYT